MRPSLLKYSLQNRSFLPLVKSAWATQPSASVKCFSTPKTNLIGPLDCPINSCLFHPMVMNKMLNLEYFLMVDVKKVKSINNSICMPSFNRQNAMAIEVKNPKLHNKGRLE